MQTLPMIYTSPETAFSIPDYPFGYVLRCQKRVWVEYKPKQGYRVVSQTSNPKKPGLVWNKPKAGVYHFLLVLVLDEQEHVQIDVLHQYNSDDAEIDAFAEKHAIALVGAREQAALAFLRAINAAMRARREAREKVQAQAV